MNAVIEPVELAKVVSFCDERTRRREVKDFPGAENGLQLGNNGKVHKIAAAVDASENAFQQAISAGADFLIVHHGLFWAPLAPITGSKYHKIAQAVQNNLACYGSHLPLDAHPEIGNNALLAKALLLEKCGTFLPFEGVDIGLVVLAPESRKRLRQKLETQFTRVVAMEYGSETPEKAAILTGSGASAVDQLPEGVDTLVTGELKQHHFAMAQELRLNLYCCGHYATEVFGVQALASEAANHFGLPWEFLPSECPL